MTPIEIFQHALSLQKAGRFQEAILAYQQGMAGDPTHPDALYNLGLCLQRVGRAADAAVAYQRALAVKPDYADAYNNLAAAYRTLGRFDLAAEAFERAIVCRPDCAEAHSNLGYTLHEAGHFERAIAEYHAALRINPNYADAHLNLALSLLLLGDFERGLQHYEARMAAGFNVRREMPVPRWNGENLKDKSIILYHEQGFGDTIHFVRYATLLAQYAGRVIVGCQQELLRLLRSADGIAQLITSGEPIPACDVHCPLASLPLMFHTRLQTIPATPGYLKADPRLVERWRERFNAADGRVKVGLCWTGGLQFEGNRTRAPFLPAFAPLGDAKNACFYSLQKGPAGEQARSAPAGMEIIDWTADLTDFAETAALMANLDLIITSDTAVAHLAGALARPTWLVLCTVPDWRWLLHREDTPWYPTMRLFRQSTAGDWSAPMRRMADELGALR